VVSCWRLFSAILLVCFVHILLGFGRIRGLRVLGQNLVFLVYWVYFLAVSAAELLRDSVDRFQCSCVDSVD
jgi:hypothetical protein